MNELEKALEQLNIKYETNGKQYKIPTTKENLVELLKGYIAMTINLQTKIDKAIEFVESMEYCGQEDYFYDNKSKDPCGNDNTFNDSKNKLLDILKGSDKECQN